MIYKIDWISFSVQVNPDQDTTEPEAFYHAAQAIRDLHQDLPQWLALDTEWEARNGRAPYRTSWLHPGGGITIFTHPALTHALIEISGRGCDTVAADGFTNDVLRAVRDRLTRLDIACDMLTDTRPKDFVSGRSTGRFKAHSEMVSESGETAYVGARSSARYARVYRWNPPHERSHFLRCEYVVKQHDAKILADTVQAEGLASVVASLGSSFGWQHRDWKPDAEPVELAVYRPERHEGKTLFWLAGTVAPLLARLHQDGVIDVDLWIAENVKQRLEQKS